jgi:acyl carrier protein
MEVKNKIRNFIQHNINILDEEIQVKDNDNIFQLGFVDSMFAMKLVSFLEKEFGIELTNDELTLENFHSVDNMFSLLNRKQAPAEK